ncbi:MAG: flagellin FliC [Acidobacteria bacterium]|nr:flagellin FliC [Acidobacteriota bacterium]
MGSILNNISSLAAQRNLAQSEKKLTSTIGHLSTGLRINKAADDAAGLQISNNLRADIRILQQARRNANDGIGIITIADGVMEEATNLLTRAAQLAEQAASGHTSSAGRVALNQEFGQIVIAITNLGTDTLYDGSAIFGASFSIQVGDASVQDVLINPSSLSATSLGIAADNLATSTAAETALGTIQTAISQISATRGNLGASQARLETIINSLAITAENVQAAESQIRDAEIAEEVVALTRNQILVQTGTSALAQANVQAQSVLSLLQ